MQTIIAKDDNYHVSASSCCEAPVKFMRIPGTHNYRIIHKQQVVAVHPWYSARAHVLEEAVAILVRENIISSEEAHVARTRLCDAAWRCSAN